MSEKKLSKNIIIYGLSNGIKSLVPFIMLPVLTTYLSAEGLGLISIIETSILFVSPFILLNIDAGVRVEYFKLSKSNLATYLTNGLLLSLCSFLLISVLFFFLRNWINQVLEIPVAIILLLPIFVLLRLIPSLVLVIFQVQQKPVHYLFYSLAQTLIDFALSALFIMIWLRGYIGRLEGTYLAFFAATLIGLAIITKMGYFKFSISLSKIKQVLRFGVPLIPHVIGGTIIAMSDRFFISHFLGNERVGIYTASYQVAALMLLFSTSVNQAWNPTLFKMLSEGKFPQIKKLSNILLAAFALTGAITYSLKDILFQVLIDPEFNEAKLYFGWLLLGFVLQAFYFVFSGFLFYYKKTKTLASITFSGAIVNLVLNYALIIPYGVLGVAYATAITWLLFLLATFVLYKKLIRIHA